MDVGAEIQLAGQNAMAAPVTRKKGHLAAFQRPQDIGLGRIAKGSLQRNLTDIRKAGHGVQATAADNADFRLLQRDSPGIAKLVIIPKRKAASGSMKVKSKTLKCRGSRGSREGKDFKFQT